MRTLTPREVLRFEFVRGVLLDQITLDEGADALGIDRGELARLVAGARAAVIRELGFSVLEEARHPYRLAS